MKTTKQLLGAVSTLALIAMTSAPGLAQGTTAGSTIRNDVTVSFNVGGVTQNAEVASDEFLVDQRVNVNVVFAGTAATSVAPGQSNSAIAFDVTNLSNSSVDLELTAALRNGNGANIGNFRIFRDTNGDRVLSAEELAAGPIDYLDEVGSSATGVTTAVIVLSDIGLDAVNADTFEVVLTANAHAAGTAGALGNELVESATNTANVVDTVLFDGEGVTDIARDGAFSASGVYSVAGANITVLKTSRVVSDPVNFSNNPKAIPGATVEYCITVANAANAATATDVNVIDDLPSDVTFVADSTRINGDANCTNGTAGGTYAPTGGASGSARVSGSLLNIEASQTRSLYFQVTID
jgi:uncharacterized repeat protein (TIGR01451 family)